MNTCEKQVAKKSKSHTAYHLKDGTRVPGVTTITGVMDKPALVKWANNLGLQGIDSTKYVDGLANIGTLTHYMIECHLNRVEPDLADYTPNEVDAAKKCFGKFINWERMKGMDRENYAVSEGQLVSEKHRFGGTIDICAVVGGKATLIDIKTAKGIYGEHKTQVAGGYRLLAEEAGYGIEDIIILRVGRDDTEGFEEITVPMAESDLHVKRFLICRDLYDINQKIGR